MTTQPPQTFDVDEYFARKEQAEIKGLAELIIRLQIRFSPNHELDGMEPEIILDHFYVAPTPTTEAYAQYGARRGGGWKRAELTLVFGEIDNLPEDGGPYCINVPIKVWAYGYSAKEDKYLWKVADRSTDRIIKMMWENFGYVLY